MKKIERKKNTKIFFVTNLKRMQIIFYLTLKLPNFFVDRAGAGATKKMNADQHEGLEV